MQFVCDTFILMLLLRLSYCLNLFATQLLYISCRRSLTADTQNALLLLRFKFTSQRKADNNTCNGLSKQEGDFHSKHLSSNCCLHAIMKNLCYKKTALLKNGTIWRPVFSSSENGTPPLQKRDVWSPWSNLYTHFPLSRSATNQQQSGLRFLADSEYAPFPEEIEIKTKHYMTEWEVLCSMANKIRLKHCTFSLNIEYTMSYSTPYGLSHMFLFFIYISTAGLSLTNC
jgi:hypothetical protein